MKAILIIAAVLGVNTAFGQNTGLQATSIKSDVYAWKNLQVEKKQRSERRQIINGASAVLPNLEVHAVTLKPKSGPQPKNRLDEEIMLLIKEGSVKVSIGNKQEILGAGSVAFAIPKDEIGIENAGNGIASYYVFRFTAARDSTNMKRAVDGGGSFMMNWNNIVFRPHDKGGVRQYFNRGTGTLHKLDIHVTTLNAGIKSHEPHTHKAEEIILMIDGNAEMQIADSFKKTTTGDLIYLGSDVPHAIRNDDTKPCMYYAIQWQ
jgi:(S)-ureidoglycine aminohydrolase